jgi:hypothetical protein
MSTLRSILDAELITRLPLLVQAERLAMADVIEHLRGRAATAYVKHATAVFA